MIAFRKLVRRSLKYLRTVQPTERQIVASLVIFSGIFIFWRLGHIALIDWDESIYAGVAREMAERGDWLTLHWNRDLFFEKPPLFFWMAASLFKIFGVSEFTARLWPAVFGILGVWGVYLFGKKLFDRKTGILSALVLATTVHWVFQSRNATLDIPAATLTLFALYFFWRAWFERRYRDWLLTGLLTGLTFMMKGPVSLVPVVVLGLFAWLELLTDGRWGNHLLRLLASLLLLLISFLVVVVPWHFAMYHKFGEAFIDEYFFYHMLARARMGIEQHEQTFLWYLVVIRHWARLWWLFFLGSLVLLLDRIIHRRLAKVEIHAVWFLLLWMVLTFLIFSAAVSKIQWYIIPIYLPFSLICGRFLFWWGELLRRWLPRLKVFADHFDFKVFWRVFIIAVALFGFLGLMFSREQWYLWDYNRGLAEASRMMAKVSGENDVLLAAMVSPGVPIFYSERAVETAKVSDVFKAAIGPNRFFSVTRDFIYDDLAKTYPSAEVSVFYKDLGYTLFGRP